MDRERMQHEGRLSVKEKERKRLELKIKGLIESVRLHLDPLEPIEDLNMAVAFEEMTDLAAAWAEHQAVLADIKATKKMLGQ